MLHLGDKIPPHPITEPRYPSGRAPQAKRASPPKISACRGQHSVQHDADVDHPLYRQTSQHHVERVEKTRLSGSEVKATTIIGDVKDKDVIMVDDIVSTAGSLTEAARLV